MLKSSNKSTETQLQRRVQEMQQKIIKIIQSYLRLQQINSEKDQKIDQLTAQNHHLQQEIERLQKENASARKHQKQLIQYVPQQKFSESEYLKRQYQKGQSHNNKIHSKPKNSMTGQQSESNYIGEIKTKKLLNQEEKSPYMHPMDHERKSVSSIYSNEYIFDDSGKTNISTKQESFPSPNHHSRAYFSPDQLKFRQSSQRNLQKNEQQFMTIANQQQKSSAKIPTKHLNESEAIILKQLWEERDRQIQKMDDMFENINKRLSSMG